MVAVNLGAIFLNDVADPSDYLRLVYVRRFSKNPGSVRGEVRRMAGGRTRLVLMEGRDVSWELTFGTTTPEEKEWLVAHTGRLLCVRDDRGGKFFGAYLESPWDERTWSKDAENVQLSITELTHSEVV